MTARAGMAIFSKPYSQHVSLYSYSQIVCKDCLAFMIVSVTKAIQSVLQAHSRQYMTGNYTLNMYKLFVC